MMVERALFVPNICISGVSVACATATTNPIDVVKVRMQALNTMNAKNANVLQTFRLVFRERGVGGFYVGLTPSLVRATTYGGLRLGLYDPIRRNLASNSEFFGGVDENRVTTKLLAGGCSGALAAFTLNPTELVKTRRMKGDSWQTIKTQVGRDGV